MLQSLETRACENEASTRNIRVRLLLPLGQVGGNRVEPGAGPRASWAQVKDPGLQEQRAAESHSGKEAVRLSSTRAWAAACQLAQFSLPAALA